MSWTTGYSLPPLSSDGTDWETVRDEFEWDLPETYNIAAEILADRGRVDATALVHVDADDRSHRFGYGELDRAAAAVAARLSAEGVGRGDRLGVCLPQCPEHLLVHLAAYRLGAVVVPLSVILGEDSLRYSLEHADATVLVVDRERRAELRPEAIADVETVIPVEPGGYDGALGGLREHVDPDTTVEPVETGPDDPALILYTSGTSGKPKGVLAGHRYLLGSLPAYHCYFHLFTPERTRRARVWSPSEWAWAGALFDVVFPTLALGGTVVSRERRSGFDPDRALGVVERQRVTHAFFPPTALGRIRTDASLDGRDLSSLEVIMCGGEKLPPSLFRWTRRALDVAINESYGQTEANGLVGNCQAVFDARAGSMGRPYPGHEVAVVGADGEVLPPDERGELAVRPPDPSFFLKYLDRPEATNGKFDDGWFLTGDLARMDENGRLWHAGRADDLIITSGYRVSPIEVERVLASDGSVADAVVGGVPDPERGERVKAYVMLTATAGSASDERRRLRERVRSELGAHKVPREFEFVESLPETRSGKADRSALFSRA